jgi:hypothetical protein
LETLERRWQRDIGTWLKDLENLTRSALVIRQLGKEGEAHPGRLPSIVAGRVRALN